MNELPGELAYAPTHEWARLDEDGRVVVGITDYAQEQLGDVVYVELPEPDQAIEAAQEIAVVESVKAASDIFAPVAGTIVAVNEALEDGPELVNEDPYGAGWFFAIEPNEPADLDGLLDARAYSEHCASLATDAPDDEAPEGEED